MNFNYNEDQQSIQDVAIRMFRDLCGDEAIRNLYKQEQPLHTELWQQLTGRRRAWSARAGGPGAQRVEALDAASKTFFRSALLSIVAYSNRPLQDAYLFVIKIAG